MNKLVLVPLLCSSLFMAACGDKSLDRPNQGNAETVASPIVSFSPSEGVISTPNDLLISADAADPSTFGRLASLNCAGDAGCTDAQLSLSQLDGWSLT